MNRKISSNISIILLLIILGLSYVYMNLPNNYVIQIGGAEPPIPPECIPITYKFRYIFYFFLLFMILVVVRFYIYYRSASQYSFSDFMQKFFNLYGENTNGIKNKTITTTDKSNYDTMLSALTEGSGQYAKYASAFCNTVSPCSCCNEPGYQHPCCPNNTPGYMNPNSPGYTPCSSGTPSKTF
jgi:hypothetical protein